MARYRAYIRGNRSPATRLGSASSGIAGHVHSWTAGISVTIDPDSKKEDEDRIRIFLTNGSNGLIKKTLATFRVSSTGEIIEEEE